MLPAPCSGSWRSTAPPRRSWSGPGEQAKASVLMGLESIQARMSHLGTSQLLYGSVLEQDDILDAYDAVTVPQLQADGRSRSLTSPSSLWSAGGAGAPGGGVRPAAFPLTSPSQFCLRPKPGAAHQCRPGLLRFYQLSASFPSAPEGQPTGPAWASPPVCR